MSSTLQRDNAMEISVVRYSSGEESTLGLFLINGKFACYTLEDEERAFKVAGETRIPANRYRIKLRTDGGQHEKYSRRFPTMHKGMLHITDVPNFRWIQIHIGNDADATEGCLLVGDEANNNNIRQGFIKESENAYRRIYPPIAKALEKGEEVWINYFDTIPLAGIEKKEKPKQIGIVAPDSLNLRQSPGGKRAGVLLKDTPAEIKGTSGNWHQVDVSGWVSANYLKIG